MTDTKQRALMSSKENIIHRLTFDGAGNYRNQPILNEAIALIADIEAQNAELSEALEYIEKYSALQVLEARAAPHPMLASAVNKARDALAKARGES